jgi:parallel beta-helix repeat protein
MPKRRSLVPLLLTVAVLALPASAAGKVIKVGPGESIQAGVNAADPGDTVQIAPGTYTEATQAACPPRATRACAVVVTEDDISIVGRGEVVLEPEGDQDNGITVGARSGGACVDDPSLRIQGSLIKNITIQGFNDDGILLACVEDWRLTQITAIDNRGYGVFPSRTFNGRVDHSFASGADDTGIYVGQSEDARIDHNVATDNVSGYEIENSRRVRADHNLAFGNTGGLLSFALPGLSIKENTDHVIEHNIVRDNNRLNTCRPGDAVCGVFPGTGMLVMASDDNVVRHNQVTGNDSFGIAVANICLAQGIPPQVCPLLDIDPDPDDNRIVFNTVTGNGLDPAPGLPGMFATDLAWDGTGSGNCWARNVFNTAFPPELPGC